MMYLQLSLLWLEIFSCFPFRGWNQLFWLEGLTQNLTLRLHGRSYYVKTLFAVLESSFWTTISLCPFSMRSSITVSHLQAFSARILIATVTGVNSVTCTGDMRIFSWTALYMTSLIYFSCSSSTALRYICFVISCLTMVYRTKANSKILLSWSQLITNHILIPVSQHTNRITDYGSHATIKKSLNAAIKTPIAFFWWSSSTVVPFVKFVRSSGTLFSLHAYLNRNFH